MKQLLIGARNSVNGFLYSTIFKRIFFMRDPETVHDGILNIGKFLGSNFLTRNITALLFSYSDRRLNQNILNIDFPNPIGLAAGFDKNAQLTDILPSIGSGL